MIENGIFKGFGFIPESVDIHEFGQFENYITLFQDNRYARQVINAFTLKPDYEQIMGSEQLTP